MLILPPKLVCISVGSLCGYRCIFCSNTHRDAKTQSLSNIIKILENFKKVEIIDISGFGDLLLHPEFEKIVSLMTENKIAFSFITTAENLTPDKQELLRNSSLFRINISLNSLNPETKKFLSGNCGNFDKVIKHFKDFVKKPRNYTVSISMVVCSHTYKEIPDFVRFGIEHGVERIVLHRPHPPTNNFKYPIGFDLKYDDEEWKYFDEGRRIADENKTLLLGFYRKENTKEIKKYPISQCKSPWENIVITPLGDIIPCLCGIGNYVIGNIYNQPFDEIWNGEKITELRNAILNGDNKFCKQCGRYE